MEFDLLHVVRVYKALLKAIAEANTLPTFLHALLAHQNVPEGSHIGQRIHGSEPLSRDVHLQENQ